MSLPILLRSRPSVRKLGLKGSILLPPAFLACTMASSASLNISSALELPSVHVISPMEAESFISRCEKSIGAATVLCN